jgi:hypothetical protein
MHHFSTCTYNTISSRQSAAQLWQMVIPLRAVEHPFFMHVLLALSASHLSHLHPNDHQKYATISSHHQNLVLDGFRSIMLNVTPETCTAVFAVAGILSILSMTVISLPVDKNPADPVASVDDILQSFVFTRGVRDVLRPAWGWLRASPISIMIQGNLLPNYEDFNLPRPLQAHLSDLTNMLQVLCEPTAISACTVALTELEKIFKDIMFLRTDTELEMGVIVKWMPAVPGEFITLIRSRDPAALVLLAHFVILFELLRTRWYVQDWSSRAFLAVKCALPEREWPWLAWPEEQLRNGLPDFKVAV